MKITLRAILTEKNLICLFYNLALCITLSSLVVVVKKCQWADNSSLSLFLRFSATFCPHAWSAASSPPVCLRVCLWCGQLLEVCWNSAAGTLPESRYSEPSLPASYYLLGFEHYLWLCMCVFGISYVCLSGASWWKSTWAKITPLSKSFQFCISSAQCCE